MKTIVVTGAAGFIGSHICEQLLADGHSVIGIDDLSMGSHKNMSSFYSSPRYRFICSDIKETHFLSEITEEISHIAHFAGAKIPRYGDALKTLQTNSIGTENILRLATRAASCVLIASTSDVYGKNPNIPFSEEHDSVLGPSTIPRWAYASSKLYDEHLGFAYQQAHKVPVIVTRLFGSYGPRHHLSWWGGPQSTFISAALSDQVLELHGDGKQTRSFCFIEDTTRALTSLLFCSAAHGQIVNVGATEEISIRELGLLVLELTGKPSDRLTCIPYSNFGKYEDVMRRVPDIAKLTSLTSFKPSISLREGLLRTIEWQKTQPFNQQK
jgi:UDP-glucose 4-epimerase